MLKILRYLILCALGLLSHNAYAEELACTYRWAGKSENHPVLIDIVGDVATTRGGYLNREFRVIENSRTDLIIIQTNTKASSGKEYPVGASLIVLDRATGIMVRSNTHTDNSFNNHAIGQCIRVLR